MNLIDMARRGQAGTRSIQVVNPDNDGFNEGWKVR